MNDEECWLPVVGYEGCYEVSNYSRVKSLTRILYRQDGNSQRFRERILRPGVDKQGRWYVTLYQLGAGAATTHRVHVLALTAFVGPRPSGAEGCHWDDNPANNYIGNLRWGTSSDNKLDRVRNGIHHNSNKTACPLEHLLQHPNLVLSARGRSCLACTRAYGYRHRARRAGREFDFRIYADRRYESIMASVDLQGVAP